MVNTLLEITLTAGKNPPTVRNDLLPVILSRAPSELLSLPPANFGPTNTTLVLAFQTLIRTGPADNRLLVMGAVADKGMWQDPTKKTSFHLDDMANGTGLATAADSDTVACDDFILESKPIADIIWVVDESGSMEDNTADIVNNATDYNNPLGFTGPTGLDRTSQLGIGAVMNFPWATQVSFATHWNTATPLTLVLPNSGLPGEIFRTDWTGDGTSKVGVFRDGQWHLDTNGNRELDAPPRDLDVHPVEALEHRTHGDQRPAQPGVGDERQQCPPQRALGYQESGDDGGRHRHRCHPRLPPLCQTADCPGGVAPAGDLPHHDLGLSCRQEQHEHDRGPVANREDAHGGGTQTARHEHPDREQGALHENLAGGEPGEVAAEDPDQRLQRLAPTSATLTVRSNVSRYMPNERSRMK